MDSSFFLISAILCDLRERKDLPLAEGAEGRRGRIC